MSSLSNEHDLHIGGNPDGSDVMNGFIDDIRINNIVDRYGNSYVVPTTSHDRGLGDKEIRRPILIENLSYSPTEEISLSDIEVYNTTFDERSSGTVSFLGRMSDGSTIDITPYRTISQIGGYEFGSVNGYGSVVTGNVRYTTGVISGKIHVRYKGILEKEFTLIVNDTIQKDLNLIDALSVAGVGSIVCVDAGDPASGFVDMAVNLGGYPNFEYGSGVTRVGDSGQMDAYWNNPNGIVGIGVYPEESSRPWSDDLHKSGTSYSFCIVTRSTDFTICGTWSNSTSDVGLRIRCLSTDIRAIHYGRATSPTAETALTVFTNPPNISGWTFIAGTVTPGGDIFFRKNKEYLKIKSYRRSTTTTTLPSPVDVLSGITLNSPANARNPSGQFGITSSPGTSGDEGPSHVACFAFMLGAVADYQFDAIYDSIKERYGLPE